MMKNILALVVSISSLAMVVTASAQSDDTKKPLIEVTVENPKESEVNEYLDINGTFSASQSVNLIARVAGQLESVNFEPGSFVEEGQLLFTIEPDTYQQEVNLNRARLGRLESEYQRQLRLIAENATSVASVENYRAQRDEAVANTKLAEINLGYTKITAPFSGRIGRNLVDVGNLVGYGDPVTLAVIEQITPAYVYFNISSRELLKIRGQNPSAGDDINKTEVMLGLQSEEGYPHKGELDFVGSGVDLQTGTLQARAVFKNEGKLFLPGYYARLRIPLGKPHEGLLIPDSAIQEDLQGTYVFVLDQNDVVKRQGITKGVIVDGLREITQGLKQSDRVVVNGQVNVSVGEKVSPQSQKPNQSSQ